MAPGRSGRRTYRPFFDFSHAQSEDERAFFRVRRTISPVDEGLDVYLSVDSGTQDLSALEEETLSIDVTCTHRSLPARLQIGDINAATPTSPSLAKFKNIVAVTRPVRPPLGSELHWRLLSHLALNQRSLADANALRAVLELYNFQVASDEPAARANQLRAEAIRAVESQGVTRFIQGSPVRGRQLTVDVNEAGFAGLGDAFLLGAVLDDLFSSQVSLNSFAELWLRFQPSQAVHKWRPRSGTAAIF
jgi:type VI secretion system protein ImpG